MKPLDPWQRLEVGDARRVDSAGRFDFFWVLLDAGTLGLMLKLPAMPDPVPKLPKLKNLTATFRQLGSGSAFVLSLKERSQVEIFETLCLDVVGAGEAAENRDDALVRAIQRTRRWHHLLRGGRTGGLSVEEQRGLVGELSVLRELVADLGTETSIDAWKGPTGSAKDFEFIGTCIEVKTRRAAAKPNISISSADQLSDVPGSRLLLRVTNVASVVLPEGLSLHDHVRQTEQLFEMADEAFEKWEEAIYSTGYDPENDYDERRWQLGASADYEVISGFPRISTPLPSGVDEVRYSLSLDACAPFAMHEKLIDVIRTGLEP
ncbi:PD-(D/E)XK motif protein [Hoeflea sp. Naph1]|uniref:PD-(D/E)XK motif protein n=1 Tax=Hoeflea sp. Naph1 TaxID=3388653 RepID=UPI00398F962D